MKNTILLLSLLVSSIFWSCNSKHTIKEKDLFEDPEQLYGDLFYAVQNDTVFPDSKTFVDCTPKHDISVILSKFKDMKNPNDVKELRLFISQNFTTPTENKTYVADSLPINKHISALWSFLKRNPDKPSQGTYIPLPNPYIVPGGRFQEIYYWDSYFTMLGLQVDGHIDMIQNMVDNFAYLINKFGFIPNGNRTYYLGRSQPPFFSSMIQLLSESKRETVYKQYLPFIQKEYNFWMQGDSLLNKTARTYRRIVLLPDGEILNRYWDDRNTPRSEAYRQDVKTAQEAKQNNPSIKLEDVYRNLRAGAESGWDFSSRWLTEVNHSYPLSTIHTTDFIPVDLNCLMYNMEMTLVKAYRLSGREKIALMYEKKAQKRVKAIVKYCWNDTTHFFFDYDFAKGAQSRTYTLAGVFPLYFKIASQSHAKGVSEIVEHRFLCKGGLLSTVNITSQQWDAPNGWAPLQWTTITGLRNYGYLALAAKCKYNWLRTNEMVYAKTYKLTEKYNVLESGKVGEGGEYKGQDGFGWSNGVYMKLSTEK